MGKLFSKRPRGKSPESRRRAAEEDDDSSMSTSVAARQAMHDAHARLLKYKVQRFRLHYERNDCPSEVLTNFEVHGIVKEMCPGVRVRVRYVKDGRIFTMSCKTKTSYRNAYFVKLPLREKKIQYALDFPFICKLYFAFKNNLNLYLVMDHATYGDLFDILRHKKLTETETKVVAAQVFLALEFMHMAHVMYRALCMGCVSMYQDGYVKLSYFQNAKVVHGSTTSFVGNVNYLAPEMILRETYRHSVDWWGFGIFIYELLMGRAPFDSPKVVGDTTEKKILTEDVLFNSGVEVSEEGQDLITSLLEKKPADRLGSFKHGARDIRYHPWFHGLDFLAVYNKSYKMKTETYNSVEPKPCDDFDYKASFQENLLKKEFKDF